MSIIRESLKALFWLIVIVIVVLICTALFSISWIFKESHLPKHIQESPGEWKIISPGKPLDKFPTVRVIEEGKGPAIGIGYLIQLNIRSKYSDRLPQYVIVNGVRRELSYEEYHKLKQPDPTWHDKKNWWTWTGFTRREETAFFHEDPDIESALIGLKEGSTFEFTATPDGPKTGKYSDGRLYTEQPPAGWLYTNIIGDHQYYEWRKNLTILKDSQIVNISPTPGLENIKGVQETHLKILRICKADLKVRTVRLFDDSPVRVNTNWFSGYVTKEPREAWIDEAKVEGQCTDGRTATFQYGPVISKDSDATFRSPVRGYFDEWDREKWKKLPVGVQLTPAEDSKKE